MCKISGGVVAIRGASDLERLRGAVPDGARRRVLHPGYARVRGKEVPECR